MENITFIALLQIDNDKLFFAIVQQFNLQRAQLRNRSESFVYGGFFLFCYRCAST